MGKDIANLSCAFCFKQSKDVKKLIQGPNIYICDECVNICYNILNTSSTKVEKKDRKISSAFEIKAYLDQFVIGQDEAKQSVAVAINNHYKRIENPIINGVEIDKSNILIRGPSGCGKTHIFQNAAKFLDVPFVMIDTTTLTESGYSGDDADTIITKLLTAADNNISKAEMGIIFLDEIDKKRNSSGGSHGRDVSGEGVQQALLKIIEGTDVYINSPGLKKTSGELIKLSTKNILFVVCGAFVGIEKIVEQNINETKTKIGFGADTNKKIDDKELSNNIDSEHFVKYGIIPELIGRLPVIINLQELTEEELVKILIEPKNSIIKQYQGLFSLENIELEFTDESLKEIARIAKKKKTNGRALRNVLERSLMKIQFNLSLYKTLGVVKIIITPDVINNISEPLFEY